MHSPKARGPLQTPTEGWRKGSCVMEKLYFPLGFLQKELRSATQQELVLTDFSIASLKAGRYLPIIVHHFFALPHHTRKTIPLVRLSH